MNHHHKELLERIKIKSRESEPAQLPENYFGTTHPVINIKNPELRAIIKTWMKEHKELTADELTDTIISLMEGTTMTEKMTGGLLLDYSTAIQREFNPLIFDFWLKQTEGWVEVDTLCTGRYAEKEIFRQWKAWKPLLIKFSKTKSISHRRASLVLFCSPLRKNKHAEAATLAFENIKRLKHINDKLITKAISWLLRSMIKYHRKEVVKFLKEESDLPAIAVRETQRVLTTGKKSG